MGLGKVDLTIGSALDIFGGDLLYTDVVAWDQQQRYTVLLLLYVLFCSILFSLQEIKLLYIVIHCPLITLTKLEITIFIST